MNNEGEVANALRDALYDAGASLDISGCASSSVLLCFGEIKSATWAKEYGKETRRRL